VLVFVSNLKYQLVLKRLNPALAPVRLILQVLVHQVRACHDVTVAHGANTRSTVQMLPFWTISVGWVFVDS